MMAQGQETNQIDKIERQLKDMQENFEKQQREMKESFERLIQQQQEQIEALKKQLAQATNVVAGATATNQPSTQPSDAERQRLQQELAAKLGANAAPSAAPPPAPAPATAWSPTQPITIGRAGQAYMNISFDVLMDVGSSTAHDPSAELQLGDHDPISRGFSLRNAEIALDGAVDPYFKGFGNIVLKLDKDNETSIELEEAYLVSSSLPANLQLKAGQFFANFGRQNSQHPHQWAFVDEPLILTRTFGPDGLRNVGAQVSWLAPTPFFTEVSLGVMNGEGSTAFSFRNLGDNVMGTNRFHGRATLDRTLSGAGDLLYVPRISSSFDLTDQQTIVLGISGAFGPNDTESDARTEIGGVDLYWKWKAANSQAGFPFVSWQTEALIQRFEAGADPTVGLPSETLRDWGFYSQVLWGFTQRWVAGLRGEYVNGNEGLDDPNDVFRGERTRVSPNLTFYPSEFSKLRLQYNYDHGERFGTDHSIWLQMEFLLGAHGAHKF
ncbi:MAG: hypothetical protein C5B50_28475 [Verrucomicrobia bacterium]|nr:MAG: hypothetical protein C5B50_28475 [Verrucomicrobiota bacterium]